MISSRSLPGKLGFGLDFSLILPGFGLASASAGFGWLPTRIWALDSARFGFGFGFGWISACTWLRLDA